MTLADTAKSARNGIAIDAGLYCAIRTWIAQRQVDGQDRVETEMIDRQCGFNLRKCRYQLSLALHNRTQTLCSGSKANHLETSEKVRRQDLD